jgi:hypothetical protein
MRLAPPLCALRSRRLTCEPLEPRLLLADTPLISEIMAANDTSLDDEDGDDSDWIEIYNPTPAPVDLGGWYLTDNPRDLDKWRFPPVTLAPNDFLVVFASDKDRTTAGSELHTNFKLDADGEYAALVMPDGSIASEIMPGGGEFPPQTTDVSFGLSMPFEVRTLVASGANARFHVPTDGQIDSVWMRPDFDDSACQTGPTGIGYTTGFSPGFSNPIATEIPRASASVYVRIPFTLSDIDSLHALTLRMQYDDGFVAYLNGVRVLSINAPDEATWNSTATQSRSDRVVLFEDFRIDAFRHVLNPGENLLAIHGLNRSPGSADMLVLPELTAIDSVIADGLPGILAVPTSGLPNGFVVNGFTEPPSFGIDRGFYDETFLLTLMSASPDAEIRYTTDGSQPTATTGTAYREPLMIDRTTILRAAAFRPDYAPSTVVSHTYIFVDDVMQQDDAAMVARGFPSSPANGMDTNVIGPDDLFGGVYAATIRDDLQALPTLSITMDIDDLFGPLGIYANGRERGPQWERTASVEFIDSQDDAAFQIDAALRIHGGASRGREKQSLRLLFKGEFGPPNLVYPFFGPQAAQEFNTLVLRMEFNDGFLDQLQAQYARDEFARRTQLAMGWPSAHGRYVHVYINGIYWGVYNAAERPDAAFAASYYGGERQQWDIIRSGFGPVEVMDGNVDAWDTLLALAHEVAIATDPMERHAAYMRLQGLNRDGSNNPAWESYLNVDNYIDYLIVNFYGGNNDWPHRNWYAARRRGPDSEGFVFHIWDAEWTLNLHSDVNTNRIGVSEGVAEPYGYLRLSEEFRIRFADRAQKHFSPGGALYVNPDAPQWDSAHPENNVPAARYVEVTSEVRRGLVAESARWGDLRSDVPITPNEQWAAERSKLLQEYFPQRSSIVHGQLQIFEDRIGAPIFSLRGGDVDIRFPLELLPRNFTPVIYYTLDGSDPRLVGGGISPTASEYTGPISLTSDVVIRTRALQSGRLWSAIDEAAFVVRPGPPPGDFNGNGVVNQSDLDLVLGHWGRVARHPPAEWINDLPSGFIDQGELDRVLTHWGATEEAPLSLGVAEGQGASEDADDALSRKRRKRRALDDASTDDAVLSSKCTRHLDISHDAAFRSALSSRLTTMQLR